MSMGPHFRRDSTNMVADQLSEVLRLVEVQGALSGGFAVGGRWALHVELTAPLKFLAMAKGAALLRTDGVAPFEINAGDVVVFNSRRWMSASAIDGDGLSEEFTLTEPNTFIRVNERDDDVVLGGHIDVNEVGRELLVQALPPVVHVRAGSPDAAELRQLIDRLYDEVTGDRIGAGFAIRQLSQLLVLMILRVWLGRLGELPPGWLRLIVDEQLRPAVTAMHVDPGKAWHLDDLARIAAMSRTTFAERFRAAAGMPPLTYLNSWRMRMARQALRDRDIRVGTLAYELGYASESAFSNAFKRDVGLSPLRYRASIRAE